MAIQNMKESIRMLNDIIAKHPELKDAATKQVSHIKKWIDCQIEKEENKASGLE